MAQDHSLRLGAPPGQKYPPGRLRSGIIALGGGSGWFTPPNNGNALTNKEIAELRSHGRSGSIVGVVASTWYTGRFFEKGVNKQDLGRAGLRKGRVQRLREVDAEVPLQLGEEAGIRAGHARETTRVRNARHQVLERASAKESKRFEGRKGFYRNQRLPARPFMAPARDVISSIFESRIQAAVTKAVAGGS